MLGSNPRLSSVLRSREGPVALILLNSPPVNVLTADLLHELGRQLGAASRDRSVRVIVLASQLEKGFAAGASIREMATMGPSEAERHSALGQSITQLIESCPVPVIAAVHGICVGGGCELIQACDFVLAGEDATFGQPEINLGVMPGWGGTQRLPRWIGPRHARAWVLLGRTVDAAAARDQGLVWQVHPRSELMREALRLANELARQPPAAMAAAKAAVNAAIDRDDRRGLDYERRLWSRLFGTRDQREGMAAFLEKRPAVFGGREERAPGLRTPRTRARPPHRTRLTGSRSHSRRSRNSKR